MQKNTNDESVVAADRQLADRHLEDSHPEDSHECN
jgi:hypothetical protein